MRPDHTTVFPAMGGTSTVIVIGPPSLLDRARRRVEDLEDKWSRFRPGSEVSRLNGDRHAHHPVSDDTRLLLWRSFAAWSATDGAFDPSVLDALVAWGYDRTLDEIEARQGPATLPPPAPGLGRMEIDDAARTACVGGGALDPGGIGKGLAADLTVAELLDSGATAALVALSGDLAVGGAVDDRVPGDGWVLGIEDPGEPARDLCRLRLDAGGMASSSDRRRRWPTGADEAHHLIDPRTGRPATTDLAGVTVLAGAAWWAEALTKAVLVGGLDVAQLGRHGASGIGRRRDGTVVGTHDLLDIREAA